MEETPCYYGVPSNIRGLLGYCFSTSEAGDPSKEVTGMTLRGQDILIQDDGNIAWEDLTELEACQGNT